MEQGPNREEASRQLPDPLDDFSDKLAAFQKLRSADPDAADRFLVDLGGEFAEAEETILQEMADTRIIRNPERFVLANRRAVKAVEVLYRNGRHGAPIKGWWIFTPVVQVLQIFITSYITRAHVRRLLQNTLELYSAREAQAERGSDDWHQIYWARRHLDQLDQRYRGDRFGIPIFLFSSAVITTAVGGIVELAHAAFTSDLLILIFTVTMLGVVLAVGSGIAQAAGIAKRRIRMTTDIAFASLYRVVGAVGKPPRDFAWIVALGAIAILLLLWVIIPGSLLGVFFN